MKFNQILKTHRKALGLTQQDIADLWGIKSVNVSDWENGRGMPETSRLPALAKRLGLTISELMGEQSKEKQVAERQANFNNAQIGTRRIPLISYVQAGCMVEATDPYPIGEGADWLLTDLDLSGNAFALEIKGDSMLPEFHEGDRVIIDPSVQPRPGDFVVAKNGEDEATFKKYRPRGINENGEQVIELIPLNEDFAPLRSDTTPFVIIGVMVEHRKYRRK